ncbi:MAG: ribosome maturation factor RimM [Pseudomonadota bacterium]
MLVGEIGGAHGVKGEVRIKSFTVDPAGLAAYGPLADQSGSRRFTVRVRGRTRGLVIARLDGVGDREAAERLKGVRLYVPRSALPPPGREEWYCADLEGLQVEAADGARIGRVRAVRNFGAGDLLEIDRGAGAEMWLPFTKATVPVVDVEGGRIVVGPEVVAEGKPIKSAREGESK